MCYGLQPMTRWIPTTTLLLLCAAAAGMVAREANSKPPTPETTATEEAPNAEPSDAEAQGKPAESEGAEASAPAVQVLAPFPSAPRRTNFQFMEDGTPVPALPGSAPLKLKLGVALFRYEGTQGAGATTRSRADALALAEAASKKETFQAAVEAGDPGSSQDVGWIGRGVLEQSVEYAVFTLAKGERSTKPIDTPRGFWVVQRVR